MDPRRLLEKIGPEYFLKGIMEGRIQTLFQVIGGPTGMEMLGHINKMTLSSNVIAQL